MGNLSRRDRPWGYYHVIARGDNREPLFLDSEDYLHYLSCMSKQIIKGGLKCRGMAFCLMTNHLHLLIAAEHADLSRLIELVHGDYARWFNQRHQRVGHVFQKRFLSKSVTSERHLFEVIRYIHMNPVKAGMVARPEEYRWSSFRNYLESREDGWLDLSLIDESYPGPDKMRQFYEFTVERSAPAGDSFGWPEGVPWYDPPIGPCVPAITSNQPQTPDPEALIAALAGVFELPPGILVQSWRNPTLGPLRGAAALLLKTRTNLTLREIGRHVGLRSPQGVCYAIAQFKKRLDRDIRLRSRLLRRGLPLPFLEADS